MDISVRNVTAVNRSPLLNHKPLDRRDCIFSGNSKSVITYGPQVRVSPQLQSPGKATCNQRVNIAYSSSVSNSFGASTLAGGSLFEVISVSFEFNYEHTQ
jgi:hypothetical protein